MAYIKKSGRIYKSWDNLTEGQIVFVTESIYGDPIIREDSSFFAIFEYRAVLCESGEKIILTMENHIDHFNVPSVDLRDGSEYFKTSGLKSAYTLEDLNKFKIDISTMPNDLLKAKVNLLISNICNYSDFKGFRQFFKDTLTKLSKHGYYDENIELLEKNNPEWFI